MKLSMEEFKNELKLMEQKNITDPVIFINKVGYSPNEILKHIEDDAKFKKILDNGLDYIINLIDKVTIIRKKTEIKKPEVKKDKPEDSEFDLNDKNKK